MGTRRAKPGVLRRAYNALLGTGDPPRPSVTKIIREPGNARVFFDAADSNRYTENHFSPSTTSDINAIARAELPRLRQWCRYEAFNNSYGKGIVETLANDIVGRGPRAQVTIPGDGPDETRAQEIEDAWADWAENADADGRLSFGQILALAVKQGPSAGEAFIVHTNDPAAKRGEVSLRLRLIEADRVAMPYGMFAPANVCDGIKFSTDGRPTHYMVLKRHPGDTSRITLTNSAAFDEVPADQVQHVYRQDRPGQNRGIPWFASALIPLAHLRRYTLATVTAAENAASISGVTYTDLPGVDVEEAEQFEEVEIPRGSMMTLPSGYKMAPFEPKQPTVTYPKFKNEMLDEAGRGLSMPHNIIAGNSSGYNYASGRLDWQVYFRMIRTSQADLGRICTRIFRAWFAEYTLQRRAIPMTARRTPRPEVAWYWPGHQHVDPAKEAMAQRIRLNSLTTTLEDEYAKEGTDWRRKVDQIAIEREYTASKGLTIEEAAPAIASLEAEDAAEAAAEDTSNAKNQAAAENQKTAAA